MVRAEVTTPVSRVVGVGLAEQGGDAVVVLLAEPVAATTGDHVDGVADVEQVGVGAVGVAVRAVGQPRRGQRPQHGHVAQAAPGLLQVRLEGLGQVAVAGVPLLDGLDQLGQPLAGVAAPVVRQRWPGWRSTTSGSPATQVRSSRPDRRGQVAGGDAAALGHGADAVVEPDAGVPDRVPEPVGELGDLRGGEGAPVVQQDEVEVAERPGLAAGEAADGRERDALDPAAPGGLGPDVLQPVPAERGRGSPGGARRHPGRRTPGCRRGPAAVRSDR